MRAEKLMMGLLVMAWTGVSCAGVLSTKMITRAEDGYCGWPSVAQMGDNELVVVFSGDREGHVCPWGHVKMTRSKDGGETWSNAVVVENGVLDDRDAGIVRAADGTWHLFWFTSVAFYEQDVYRKHHEAWKRHFEKLPPDLVRAGLGSFTKCSRDGGKTWGPRVRVPASTPHGAIALKDGRLMLVGNCDSQVRGHLQSDAAERQVKEPRWQLRAVASADNGETWQVIGKIPTTGYPSNEMCEPCLVEGKDGVLRCYIRNVNLWYTESRDGGKTWLPVRKTKIAAWNSPAQIIRMADGRMLLTAARRVGWAVARKDAGTLGNAVFALIGDENATPESFEAASEILVYDPGQKIHAHSDMGYATTAQNADGSLVTVFYAHTPSNGPAAIWAVKWNVGIRK